ncbi:MAG TPA: hypothetical protein VL068_14555 [Microthrixaceae bacterium]|nr:hypothetical protein [Microthrixaceae bacterium]
MSERRRRRTTANVLVAIFLTAGLVLGTGLVVLGGDNDEPPPPKNTAASPSSGEPRPPLPLDDVGAAAVQELTGLSFPAEMTDFLTAKLQEGSQLDITFVMASDAAEEFVAASGLPEPTADKRLILHSSPLWKLTPDEGTKLTSTQDDHGQVHRVVEFLSGEPIGAGKVRARIVITPS